MGYPTITGHTGNDNTADDSLYSVYKSIELGADAFELDIRRDKVGNLVISHHPHDQKDYSSCHRLAEVFEILRVYPDIRINCDLKEDDLPLEVINMASDFGIGTERLILTGIVSLAYLEKHTGITNMADIYMNAENILEDAFFRQIKGQEKSISRNEYYLNPWKHLRNVFSSLNTQINLLAETCLEYGVAGINIPHYFLSDDNITDFRNKGVSVSVWTVNNEPDIYRFLSQEVDNLTTRQVMTAKRIRKELYGF